MQPKGGVCRKTQNFKEHCLIPFLYLKIYISHLHDYILTFKIIYC